MLTQTRIAAKEPTIFVLFMKVFFLHEYGLYRQLGCPLYSLTMKPIENSCRENTKIMEAMSVNVYYGHFMFSTIGLGHESEDALRCRILSLIVQVQEDKDKGVVYDVLA